ncbi:putative C4-dicarboxylate transporter/malic acid transport protein [Hortaea werneckii]|nr:putative C4-dicarboxylate transporter/malic acid transport protein [Hortaea werneckii]
MSDSSSRSDPADPSMRLGNDSSFENDSTHQNKTGPSTQGRTNESPQPSQDASNSNVQPKLQTGWRRIVRNFTPSWFSVTMGTGITSTLLHNLPYNGVWLRYISYVLFALNVLLFIIFSLISLLRYTLYPEIWHAMIRHPAQSLFIGTFPMGLATIVNMVAFVCVPAWGGATWKLAWALWWIDSALAMATCCYLPFVLMAHHNHNLTTVSAAWLLPIVSTIVAAASGGVVASVIPSPHHHAALITLITSYVLWGTGLPLAMCVLAIYFLRLSTQSLPAKELIVSTFLPLGPLGQGGFGIMQLGKVAMTVFPGTDALPAASHVYTGEIFYTVGFLVALLLWGFGLVWLFFAVATIHRTPKFPFNMGWWGFTFPLGVYATSTTMLGSELPSAFFRVLGTIFSVAVTLLWIVVSCGTLQRAWTGEMFFAPCLKDLEQKGTGRGTKDV